MAFLCRLINFTAFYVCVVLGIFEIQKINPFKILHNKSVAQITILAYLIKIAAFKVEKPSLKLSCYATVLPHAILTIEENSKSCTIAQKLIK